MKLSVVSLRALSRKRGIVISKNTGTSVNGGLIRLVTVVSNVDELKRLVRQTKLMF